MKNNKIIPIRLIIGLMTTATGFSQEIITVKGSDTMVILAQKWAGLYMKNNPAASIQVTGGGSGVGITALINATTDVCNSSRSMKRMTVKKLPARQFQGGARLQGWMREVSSCSLI